MVEAIKAQPPPPGPPKRPQIRTSLIARSERWGGEVSNAAQD